jgi:hypothetical protein
LVGDDFDFEESEKEVEEDKRPSKEIEDMPSFYQEPSIMPDEEKDEVKKA